MYRHFPPSVNGCGTNGTGRHNSKGSLLYGFDQLIYRSTGIACHVADDAILCVALGCGKSLKWIDEMQEGTVNYARQKLMQE